MKKILGALISIFIFVQILIGTSHSTIAIGIQAPFSGRSYFHANIEQNESWIGGCGTFEYTFFGLYREFSSPEGRTLRIPVSETPTFGVELSGGRLISLGGKDTRDTLVSEYRHGGTIVGVLLKYYFPVARESRLHPHVGGGPKVAMLTREDKVGDKYEKVGDLTNFWIAGPLGLDYDITKDKLMKLTALISFQYTISGTVTKSGTTMNYTLGLGLKRCFK